tara:strand:- start:301 stop:594 length:294 start_codon:yes stop_codon:yes gene_type:complete
LKDPEVNMLSLINKAHSIGSLVTLISFVTNVFVSRINTLKLLTLPLIIVVSLTIIGSAYFLFQSIKHKEKIENPVKNNIAFIFRIAINLVLLVLLVL